jgi:hypothetical protein
MQGDSAVFPIAILPLLPLAIFARFRVRQNIVQDARERQAVLDFLARDFGDCAAG